MSSTYTPKFQRNEKFLTAKSIAAGATETVLIDLQNFKVNPANPNFKDQADQNFSSDLAKIFVAVTFPAGADGNTDLDIFESANGGTNITTVKDADFSKTISFVDDAVSSVMLKLFEGSYFQLKIKNNDSAAITVTVIGEFRAWNEGMEKGQFPK